MNAMQGFWLGFDLGGTGTRVAVVGVDGSYEGLALPTSDFFERPVEQLAAAASELTPRHGRLFGVGIGASGPVDLLTGEIHNQDTLPQFTQQQVVGRLADMLQVPVWIDNDAVAAALAEFEWGLPEPAESLLCVTLGTGVGVALVHAGRPLRATDGQHPESGHIGVPGSGHPCYCGLEQCWEQVASRSALECLQQEWTGDTASLWREYARRLASGLSTLITIHHPQTIVIAGSVAQHWAALREPLEAALARQAEFQDRPALYASDLGPYGGARGATILARRGIGFRGLPDATAR